MTLPPIGRFPLHLLRFLPAWHPYYALNTQSREIQDMIFACMPPARKRFAHCHFIPKQQTAIQLRFDPN
jgi:hypothetical protein